MEWSKHALASLLGAVIATGAIYEVVPPAEQRYAIAAVAVVAYLLGVRMPVPGGAPSPRGKEGADAQRHWDALAGR